MKKITLMSIYVMLCSTAIIGQNLATWEIIQNPLTEGELPQLAAGQSIYVDYNNDGILDYFVIGGQNLTQAGAHLYRGNSNGTFTEILTDITPMCMGSAIFLDYDNDRNLDLLICGSIDGTTTAAATELYHNSGAPNYELNYIDNTPFIGLTCEGNDNNTRILETIDYNNDGWVDVFMSGNLGATWDISGSNRAVALYKNNHGVFELQSKAVGGVENFTSINGGSIHCGDVNNDSYADMIVSGYLDNTSKTITNLYINNGDGTFRLFPDSRTTFVGHQQGETFFMDINNDGWLDIVEIGRDVNSGWANFANIYMNNKDLTFTKSTTSGLIGGQAVVSTGDIDNDGKTDIVATGWGPNTTFFYNKGDNTFLAQPIVPDQARARGGCVNLADINNDGKLDCNIFGYRDGGKGTADDPTWPHYMLKNVSINISPNQAPSKPQQLSATVNGNKVILSWSKATDDSTPQDALRYNIYIKDKKTSNVFTYSPVDINTGKLKVAGGVPHFVSGTSITLNAFNTTDYEFGVQAVDNGNATSAFQNVLSTEVLKIEISSDLKISTLKNKIVLENVGTKVVKFAIYDVTGKNIYMGKCEANAIVESPTLTKGIYVIHLMNNENLSTQKVMLE
jgi:hypothetical protein